MSNYFEYKFIAVNTFYKYVCVENLTFGQAGGRCLVDFTIVIDKKNIESLAILGTILSTVAMHKDSIGNFEDDYKKLVDMVTSMPIESMLNPIEKEYFDDDLNFIHYKFNKEPK